MAFKDDNETNMRSNPGAQANAQASNFQLQQEAIPQQWSWHGNGSMLGAPIGAGVGSEYLNKLLTGLTEIYQQANPNVEITLLVLDNVNITALAFGVIVVCMRRKDEPDLGVGYHTLIVEATGDAIEPIFEQINGTNVKIMRYAGNAFDRDLMKLVEERVRKQFAKGPWLPVDCEVVPRNFVIENKQLMHRLALEAGLAIGTELETRKPGFKDMNLGLAQHDNNLTNNVQFGRQQIENSVGEPVRADVTISLNSQVINANKSGSINSGNRVVKISELAGFVDLIWAPVAGAVFNPYQQAQPTQTQKWAANLVITQLRSSFAMTPASVLLSVLTSLSLRDDNNWIQSMRSTPTKSKELDLYDIGALGIEANFNNPSGEFGTRIDTKTDSFHLDDLGKLIAATVQPGLMVSIDVPVCGPETWALSMFSAASFGNENAYRVIYDAAVALTNGAFKKYFQYGESIFVNAGNRVHLGYYKDKDGLRRDIRDVGYLAVANFAGERNPQTIRDWSETFTHMASPLSLRLSEREKIINGVTRESAVYTGEANRETFSGAFLDALAKGARDTGLVVRTTTPLNSNEFNNQRHGASYINGALMNPGQAFAQGSQSFGGGSFFSNQQTNYRY